MCIFCKIINKELPCHCIYEDPMVMAFLDISQVTKGHTLLIPKQHYKHFLECDTSTLKHMTEVAQILSKRIIEKTGAKGMNILSNINEIAGQSVFHFHIHLIPRYDETDACSIRFEESMPQDMNKLTTLLK